MEPNKFQAAIFDLDGTLLDTLNDLVRSMNTVLERHGLPVHSVDRYRYYVGAGAKILVKRVLPEDRAGNKEFRALCLADFLEDYGKNWDSDTHLYPGIAEMLDYLSSTDFRLGVLSNKPDAFTRLCVERYLKKWDFKAVFGERPDIRKKPAPDGALEIAKLFDIDPGRCIYLGDTSIDMKTAQGAGMFPIGVLWGFRDEKELSEAGARLLLKRPRDLMDFLQEVSPDTS